jgi:hypothetical protein
MYRNNRRRRAATLTALVRLHSKFHIRFHFHTSWAYTMRVRAFAAEVARFSHCMSNYPRSSTGLSLRGATLRGLGMTEAHVHRCYQFALSQLQLTASHRGVCHTTHVCHASWTRRRYGAPYALVRGAQAGKDLNARRCWLQLDAPRRSWPSRRSCAGRSYFVLAAALVRWARAKDPRTGAAVGAVA